jgi:putative hemolysin
LDPDPSSLSTTPALFGSLVEHPSSQVFVLAALAIFVLMFVVSSLLAISETIIRERKVRSSRLRIVDALANESASQAANFLVITIAALSGTAAVSLLIASWAAGGTDPRVLALVGIAAFALLLTATLVLIPRFLVPRLSGRLAAVAIAPSAASYRALSPVLSMARSSDFFRDRFLGGSRRASTDELKAMATAGEEHGTLEESERDLIHSIVEFGTMTVREVMVSRLDIVALPVTASLQEAVDVIRESGHSRLPLYLDHLDNIAGVVYAKDLLPYLGDSVQSELNWPKLARAPMFVPSSKKLDELLRDFQSKKTHIAIVVDEYGGTAGLVTLEDLLEEIVGDIRDEHDEGEAPMIEAIGDNTFRVDARVNLDDLNEDLGTAIDTDRFEFETLGGLIFHLTGAIPEEGEEVAFENLLLKVENIDNHRIGYVLVHISDATVDDSPVGGE